MLIDKDAKGKHTSYEIDYCEKHKIPLVTFTTTDETCKRIEAAKVPDQRFLAYVVCPKATKNGAKCGFGAKK